MCCKLALEDVEIKGTLIMHDRIDGFSSLNKNLFHCSKEKSFINVAYVCDGISDCIFSEDEHSCEFHLKNTFLCFNSEEKIPLYRVCDFISDCTDSSDELFCGKTIEK